MGSLKDLQELCDSNGVEMAHDRMLTHFTFLKGDHLTTYYFYNNDDSLKQKEDDSYTGFVDLISFVRRFVLSLGVD